MVDVNAVCARVLRRHGGALRRWLHWRCYEPVEEVLAMKNSLMVALSACGLALTAGGEARAAKVLVLANSGDAAVTADFTAKTVGHTYTAFNVSGAVPTLAMMNQHDAI